MDIEVVVPWRPGCPHRERAWRWLRKRYAETHPTWKLTEARAPAGAWRKGAAANPAIARSMTEVVIQADADVWCDDLLPAVEAVRAGAPWAIPHLKVHRLSEDGTVAVLAGVDWRDQPLDQPPYRGIMGGGVIIARREVLRRAPIDPRFVGWGQEDECHAMALHTLAGKAWRGKADLVHLWHPPQERLTRRRGSRESWALRSRYAAARNDPRAMRALLEESNVACSNHQQAVHDRQASCL